MSYNLYKLFFYYFPWIVRTGGKIIQWMILEIQGISRFIFELFAISFLGSD